MVVTNEAALKDKLVETFRKICPGAVVLRHEDKNTAGIPDISITWRRYTTWLEVKYANPSYTCRGLQKFTCAKLEAEGRCWFVIYDQKRECVDIRRPINILNEVKELDPSECRIQGFSHLGVVKFIWRTHGYHKV